MAFTKPNNSNTWWQSQADRIQSQSSVVKAKLDEALNQNADEIIQLIAELEASTGAASIGAKNGNINSTVQAILDKAVKSDTIKQIRLGSTGNIEISVDNQAWVDLGLDLNMISDVNKANINLDNLASVDNTVTSKLPVTTATASLYALDSTATVDDVLAEIRNNPTYSMDLASDVTSTLVSPTQTADVFTLTLPLKGRYYIDCQACIEVSYESRATSINAFIGSTCVISNKITIGASTSNKSGRISNIITTTTDNAELKINITTWIKPITVYSGNDSADTGITFPRTYLRVYRL